MTDSPAEMQIEINEQISLLDQAKIQAQVLLPVLRALREELGRERADEIVTRALRDWSREMFLKVGASLPGTPRQKWERLNADSLPRIGSDVDFEPVEQSEQRFDFDIRGCRYAEFFRQLGEPELGAVLLCEADFHMAEVAGEEVELERTQTIKKGAPDCDFRYRLKSGKES